MKRTIAAYALIAVVGVLGSFMIARAYSNSIVPFTAWRVKTARSLNGSLPPTVIHEVYAIRSDGSAVSRRIVDHSGVQSVNSEIFLVPERKKVLVVEPLRRKVTYNLNESQVGELTYAHTDPQCASVWRSIATPGQFGGYTKYAGLDAATYSHEDKAAKWTHYYAPALNCYEVKTVTEFKDEAGVITSVTTDETLNLIRGEPDSALFSVPSDYQESRPSEIYRAHADKFLGGKLPECMAGKPERLDAAYERNRSQQR